ncbi:hypothetical protein ACFE04_010252 [Oxalis oulophora]
METTCLCSTFLFPSSSKPHKSNETVQRKSAVLKRYNGIVFSSKRDSYEREHNNEGQLVDESMIHLRKRIEEMKMIERNYEAPEEWTDWEKQYYTSYNEFVCKVVGLLQSHLIKTRPSFALGMIALLTMSVPTSGVMIALRLMDVAHSLPIH